MRRIFLVILAVFFTATILFSQQGTYNFLRNDVSARTAALSGSFIGMKDDPNVIFYNPASLGTLTIPRISANYQKHLLDVSAGTLSYAQEVSGIGNIGAGVTYIDYGSFNRTDWTMNVLGTFGARELAFVGGIATHYDDDILVGANAKFIYSSIAEYTSTALAFDFGFLYEIAEQNLAIGGSVLNLGKQLKAYAGTNESLPLDISFGVTKKPEHLPMNLNLVFHRLNEKGNKFLDRFSGFTFGAEILMSSSVRVRVGYNNKQRKELKMGTSSGLAGLSLGGGIILKDYQIDYAYKSYNKIGGPHWFSVGINL
jgi:hypothetical protein